LETYNPLFVVRSDQITKGHSAQAPQQGGTYPKEGELNRRAGNDRQISPI